DAEGRLQICQSIKLDQDDLREGILLEFDNEAHAFTIALVSYFANTFDTLVADQLANFCSETSLVHLIRDLGNDDLLAIRIRDLLYIGASAHHDAAAPRRVSLVNA